MSDLVLYSALHGGGDPFDLFKQTRMVRSHREIQAINSCLLLHGGMDISPSIYHQSPITHNQATEKLTDRDELEIEMVHQARKVGIPIIGICRGAQLLCALDGGDLIQHIDNHVSGNHEIVDISTGEMLITNSCHHQMMRPNPKSGAVILAEDVHKTTGLNETEEQITVDKVPEIVYFPNLRAIGIQGHPEWVRGSAFTKYCTKLIKEFIL